MSLLTLLGKKQHALLRDRFLDTRAAGSFTNGMPASPGPGTRVAIHDGEYAEPNIISIADGKLKFVGTIGIHAGYVAGVWWPRLDVRAGRLCIMRGILGWAAWNGIFQLDIDTSSGGYVGYAYPILTASCATVPGVLSSGLITATIRDIAYLYRASGMFYFSRVFGANWVLNFAADFTHAYPGYYPMAASPNGKVCDASLGSICAYDTAWRPAALASDSFDRSNGALGVTDGLGHQEQDSGMGLPWTNRVGTIQVSGNKAVATSLSGGIALATIPCSIANVLLTATVARGTTGVGLVLRYTDTDNYIYVRRVATNTEIVKRVAGVETAYATAATEVASAKLLAISEGTSLRYHYNNALVNSRTFTEAILQSGAIGLIFWDTDSTADDLNVFARGSEGQYAVLEKWQ